MKMKYVSATLAALIFLLYFLPFLGWQLAEGSSRILGVLVVSILISTTWAAIQEEPNYARDEKRNRRRKVNKRQR